MTTLVGSSIYLLFQVMSIRRLHSACILASGSLLGLKVKAAEGENKGKTIKISEVSMINVLKLFTPTSFWKMPRQAVQTQIRLLPREQSDRALHCL